MIVIGRQTTPVRCTTVLSMPALPYVVEEAGNATTELSFLSHAFAVGVDFIPSLTSRVILA